MWIKYTGKLPYNSMEIRGVLPDSVIDVKENLAKKLIKKRPEWFKPCSKPKPAEVKLKEGSEEEPTEETKKKDEVKKK